jgi:uncharacterized protein GlcG (DUF336 family)
MRSGWKVLTGLCAAVMLCGPAAAQGVQGVVMVRDLSLALATAIAQGALEHCRAQNFKIGVSVVDRGGHVLITMRDDGTAHHVVELAERKAYTARIFRQTTREFVERIINNPRSQGLKDTKGALASFGGVPSRSARRRSAGSASAARRAGPMTKPARRPESRRSPIS